MRMKERVSHMISKNFAIQSLHMRSKEARHFFANDDVIVSVKLSTTYLTYLSMKSIHIF